MAEASKCVFDNFGGKSHPYGYCVKPVDEMFKRVSPSWNSFKSMAPPMSGIVNYTTSFISNPQKAISGDCGDDNDISNGKLGNRYLIKTERKCKNSGGENLHHYVDNISSYAFGRPSENLGFLPAAISSATKIGPSGLFNAITGEVDPSCVELRLKCHVIHANEPENNYTGWSDKVWISEDEARQISQKFKCDPDSENCPEGFQNIDKSNHELNHESIHEYIKNNPDLLIRNMLNNDSEHESKSKSNTKLEETFRDNEDMIINMYYLLLSIILLFIVYKLLHKK